MGMAIVEKINIANFLGVLKDFYAEWKKVEAEKLIEIRIDEYEYSPRLQPRPDHGHGDCGED
jgi:hypothetical protein